MLQRRIVKGGLAKQSAKGSAASAATYAFGVTDGSVMKVDVVEAAVGSTWSNRTVQGHDRTAVNPGMDVGFVATPALMGLVFLGVLGADAVTGAGPYTHVDTPAADLPYLTAFASFAAAEYGKVVDCKINTAELSWEKSGRLMCKVGLLGLAPSMLATSYTETNQELLANGFFVGAGGVFNVEGASAQIVGGSVKIDNKVAQIPVSASVTPSEVFPGEREITYSLKIVPNDLALFREVVFGSGAAGALATVGNSPYYGAVDLKWLGPSSSSIEITSPHCKFAVAFPAAAPAGGPAEITLEAVVAQPTSGADTTGTVINSVASY